MGGFEVVNIICVLFVVGFIDGFVGIFDFLCMIEGVWLF